MVARHKNIIKLQEAFKALAVYTEKHFEQESDKLGKGATAEENFICLWRVQELAGQKEVVHALSNNDPKTLIAVFPRKRGEKAEDSIFEKCLNIVPYFNQMMNDMPEEQGLKKAVRKFLDTYVEAKKPFVINEKTRGALEQIQILKA